jgi:hypothetical protein
MEKRALEKQALEKQALEKQQKSLEILNESLSTLYQTEAYAKDTLVELKRQDEVLKNANNKLQETTIELSKAKLLLRKLAQWWRG